MNTIDSARPAPNPNPNTAIFSTGFQAYGYEGRAQQALSYMADKAIEVSTATNTRLFDVAASMISSSGSKFSASFAGATGDAETAAGLLAAYAPRVQAWVGTMPPTPEIPRVRPIRWNPGPVSNDLW